ncbi:hypothetical protein LguiB_011234 [Lonicera macranthoides]
MQREKSACNTYNYGDALYWDARYIQEATAGSFDWYQRYPSLRPFVRKYIPTSSRILMVGCGNAVLSPISSKWSSVLVFGRNRTIECFQLIFFAVMSEDMVKDGYEDIMNVDISSVAIDMMRRKYEHIPELKYMQMDVRDMSFFPDESFDSVIDKGTLDSLMCGTDAPISAAQMLGEVRRLSVSLMSSQNYTYRISLVHLLLLIPGGIYMLITYGDPKARIPHLTREVCNWKIELYIISRPGFQRPASSTSPQKSFLEPVPTNEKGQLPTGYVLEDPDSHFIYVCTKTDKASNLSGISNIPFS